MALFSRRLSLSNVWALPFTAGLLALTTWHATRDFTIGCRPQVGGHGIEHTSESQQQQQWQPQSRQQHRYFLQPPVTGHLRSAGAAALVGLLLGLLPVMSASAMTNEEMKEWAKGITSNMQFDAETVKKYEEANPWLKNEIKSGPVMKKNKSYISADCSTLSDVNKRAKCERTQRSRALEESIPVEDGWKVKLYK